MDLIFTLAARNTLRNRRRTLFTVLTILLGATLMTLAMSLVSGLLGTISRDSTRNTGHVRIVTEAFAQRYRLNPIYENIPDTAPIQATVEAVDGVQRVYPRIQMGVVASVKGEFSEIFGLLVGAPAGYYSEVMELDERLVEGTFFTGKDDEALIGRSLAEAMGVHAGDEAIFLGQTQDGAMSPLRVTVAGVVDTGNGAFDKQIFVSLESVRYVADIPDGAVEILVFAKNSNGSAALAERVRQALPAAEGSPPLTVEAWNEREDLATMMGIMNTIGFIMTGIIALVTALGVLNTMLMSVLERTGEIGVFRAMGMGKLDVIALFVFESVSIALIGGILGTIIGSALSLGLGEVGINVSSISAASSLPINNTLSVLWTPQIAATSMTLAVVVAVVGSVIPAVRASGIQPVEAMRTRK
jgi:ABC-type lipoprotein release transport system permease subunit